jgi:hypothetical protein
MRTLIILISLIGLSLTVKSQVHWLINQDSIPNCSMMQSGKFVYQVTGCNNAPGYYFIIDNGIETEYVENGKYYVKSKLDFTSPCEYIITIQEITIPNFHLKVGDKYTVEIVETATIDNLVKIKTLLDGEYNYFVFEKIEK